MGVAFSRSGRTVHVVLNNLSAFAQTPTVGMEASRGRWSVETGEMGRTSVALPSTNGAETVQMSMWLVAWQQLSASKIGHGVV